MAGVYGQVSPKSKTAMILLDIFGFHLGLHYFYAGHIGKGVLFLLLYWPSFILGIFLFFVPWVVCVGLFVWAVVDFIKIVQGKFPDSNGLPISQ